MFTSVGTVDVGLLSLLECVDEVDDVVDEDGDGGDDGEVNVGAVDLTLLLSDFSSFLLSPPVSTSTSPVLRLVKLVGKEEGRKLAAVGGCRGCVRGCLEILCWPWWRRELNMGGSGWRGQVEAT